MKQAKVTTDLLDQYFRDHPSATQAAAAKAFGVSDRYIRKLQADHRAASCGTVETPRRRARIVAAPSLRAVVSTPQPRHVTVPQVAARSFERTDSMVLCPKCGELQHPVPGVDTPESWSQLGCYICRVQANGLQHLETEMEALAEQEQTLVHEVVDNDAEPPCGTTALESDKTLVPEPEPEPRRLEALAGGTASWTCAGLEAPVIVGVKHSSRDPWPGLLPLAARGVAEHYHVCIAVVLSIAVIWWVF